MKPVDRSSFRRQNRLVLKAAIAAILCAFSFKAQDGSAWLMASPEGYYPSMLDSADLVVKGRVVSRAGSSAHIEVERLIKGKVEGKLFVLSLANPAPFPEDFITKDSHIIVLAKKAQGNYVLVAVNAQLPASSRILQMGNGDTRQALCDELLAELADPQPKNVRAAMKALGELADRPNFRQKMKELSHSGNPAIREKAIAWLVINGDKDAVKEWADILFQEAGNLKDDQSCGELAWEPMAFIAGGQFAHASTEEYEAYTLALMRLAKHPNGKIRELAVDSLANTVSGVRDEDLFGRAIPYLRLRDNNLLAAHRDFITICQHIDIFSSGGCPDAPEIRDHREQAIRRLLSYWEEYASKHKHARQPVLPVDKISPGDETQPREKRLFAIKYLEAHPTTDTTTLSGLMGAFRANDEEILLAASVAVGKHGRPVLPVLMAKAFWDNPKQFSYVADAFRRVLAPDSASELNANTANALMGRLPLEQDWEVRRAILNICRNAAHCIPEHLDAIITATRDTSAEVRFAAATALGASGEQRVTAHLIERLSDSDNKVRKAAISALSSSKDRQAILGIIGRLSDSDEEVRKSAKQALIDHPSKDAQGELRRCLSDDDAFIRSGALRALDRIGAIDDGMVRAARQDPNWAVRELAERSIARCPIVPSDVALENPSALVRNVEELAKRSDAQSHKRLRAIANGADDAARFLAAVTLWVTGDSSGDPLVERLIAMDPSEDPEGYRFFLRAFSIPKYETVCQALQRLVVPARPKIVRTNAIMVMLNLGTKHPSSMKTAVDLLRKNPGLGTLGQLQTALRGLDHGPGASKSPLKFRTPDMTQ